MKFLCDRCKTRYSIGDDRVRGKILKIRCKNCANVITVREGMSPEGDGAPGDAAERARKAANAATEALDGHAVASRAAN
ncbi:MAG TPA: zinc-ribbon domain-containing protein, partial [Kofleriaceae bacterium]